MPQSAIAPRIRDRARSLRKAPTKGERIMWDYLRGFRALGARFRREAPIGGHVVDFAWLSARIVIEVDGASHRVPGRADQDQSRDGYLRSQGFQVVRVADGDVIGNVPEAFARIEVAIRPHLRHPFPTSPHKGEGDPSAERDT